MGWEEVKNKYSGVGFSEFLMIEYVALGGYRELEIKYDVSKTCIKAAIKSNIEYVKEEKPYIYELYKDKVAWNRKNGAKKRPKKYNTYGIYCEGLKHFEPKMFETLPAQMDYDKEFLDLMLKYNTGERTGDQLVKIAAKHGTRVYRTRNNGSKKFIV